MNTTLIYFVGLIANFTLSYFICQNGKQRQIGGAKAFWLSFLFSPIIGGIVIATSLPLTEKEKEEMSGIYNEPDWGIVSLVFIILSLIVLNPL